MSRDPFPVSEPNAEQARVMAAIDDDGGDQRLVIADLAADESWLSMPASSAARLAEWR